MSLEELSRNVDQAIVEKNLNALESIFSEGGGSSSGTWQGVGQGEQRSLAAHFVQATVKSPDFLKIALPQLETVFARVLTHLPASVPGAADNTLRQKIFDYKVNSEGDYSGAARILSTMRIEDNEESLYYLDPASKTDIYVKIAECFLAEDEIAEADSAVNKAGQAIMGISNQDNKHTALILRYKSTNARVLDLNRKFLQAASRYHEISESETDLIDAEELLQMLGRAVACAILAPSGPQRARTLGKIFRDERLSQLDSMDSFSSHSTILKKMYLNRVLRPEELTKFESTLAPHQKAIMGDGLTIMERGVIEHNMIAVGNVYSSIKLDHLATILGVDERKAVRLAASMVTDGSIRASIDEVDGILTFDDVEHEGNEWGTSIASFCSELARVSDQVNTSVRTA